MHSNYRLSGSKHQSYIELCHKIENYIGYRNIIDKNTYKYIQ